MPTSRVYTRLRRETMQAMDREEDAKESSYTAPVDLNARYCSLLFREFWTLIVRSDGPWSSDCWNV
jgi:hypothetical protein